MLRNHYCTMCGMHEAAVGLPKTWVSVTRNKVTYFCCSQSCTEAAVRDIYSVPEYESMNLLGIEIKWRKSG